MDVMVAATAIACAAMGGVFFAFSSFVMRGLGRMPPAHGIAAMQSLNVVAVTPVFMIALFGTAAACLVLAVDAVTEWHRVPSVYVLAGSLSYLIGSIAITIAFNVPLNDALAAVDPTSGDAVRFWTEYLEQWTAWNHVRAASALLAAGMLTLAIMRPGP